MRALLKSVVRPADVAGMRCARLILEAGANAVTVRFHPKLTIVAGVGRLERDSLVGELIGALSGGRGGAHVEVTDDTGRRLALVRPEGGPDRVVELETRADVSDEFRSPDGRIDLLAHLGLSRSTARRRLRVRSADLTTASQADELIARLARTDQAKLWRNAANLRDASAWLAAEADQLGADPEDAEVVAEIERRHREFEAAQARHESIRHHGIFIGGACALGAVPAAYLNRLAALPFLVVALLTTVVSVAFRRRMVNARKAEQRALEAAGAESYLGFHLQRVNGILNGQEQRGRFGEAVEHHRRALDAWRELAGDIDVDWALSVRRRVVAMVDGLEVPPDVAGGRRSTPDLATALSTRLNDLAHGGTGGESLPLILDEPLTDLDATQKWELLELVRTARGCQVILLTEDEQVAAWARAAAVSGDLAVLEPAPVEVDEPAFAIPEVAR